MLWTNSFGAYVVDNAEEADHMGLKPWNINSKRSIILRMDKIKHPLHNGL